MYWVFIVNCNRATVNQNFLDFTPPAFVNEMIYGVESINDEKVERICDKISKSVGCDCLFCRGQATHSPVPHKMTNKSRPFVFSALFCMFQHHGNDVGRRKQMHPIHKVATNRAQKSKLTRSCSVPSVLFGVIAPSHSFCGAILIIRRRLMMFPPDPRSGQLVTVFLPTSPRRD